jgi:small subunit ribosomal protein S9
MAETPENQETSEEQEAPEVAEGQEPTAQDEAAPEAGSDRAPAVEESSPEESGTEESAAEEPAPESAEEPAPESAEEPAPESAEDPAPESAEERTKDAGDAAEEPAAEKKKKKEAIPGADLEPIAVEAEERPLSAEERARREAEEEERARREAALAGESEDEEPRAAKRAPAKMERDSRYLATGKRKRSIARVTLLPGTGKIEINSRPLDQFFPRPLHQTMTRQPLATTGYEGSVDVRVRVHGGGISGQAGAVRHGIARALTEIDPELRGELKRRGFLTRDARVKERRKAGLKKARKRPQFSKR